MNTIRNAIGLVVLFFWMLVLALTFIVISPLATETHRVVNEIAPNPGTDTTYLDWLTVKAILIQGFYIIMSLIVFLSLLSSMIEQGTIMDYLLNAAGSLILTPLLIYFLAVTWNTYVATGVDLTDVSMTFVNNYSTILTMNLLFGLLSFIFVKRGQNQ